MQKKRGRTEVRPSLLEASTGPKRALFRRPSSDAPVVLEILLEASLRHEVNPGARQRLVPRKLFGIARNRCGCIVERDEEPVDEAQREDFTNPTRPSETLDAEDDLGAEPIAM